MVGTHDLKGLFQPKRCYDSKTVYLKILHILKARKKTSKHPFSHFVMSQSVTGNSWAALQALTCLVSRLWHWLKPRHSYRLITEGQDRQTAWCPNALDSTANLSLSKVFATHLHKLSVWLTVSVWKLNVPPSKHLQGDFYLSEGSFWTSLCCQALEEWIEHSKGGASHWLIFYLDQRHLCAQNYTDYFQHARLHLQV